MSDENPNALARLRQRVGRYELYGEIAAGGMASVHFARLMGEAGFARTVAIKRLHPQYARMNEFAARFVDEAKLAARIRHRNVVATLDTIAEDDELLLVMEYIAGLSIADLVAASEIYGERMPLEIALRIAADVLYGLHAAHEAKGEDDEPLCIVHRDVSPQNVLVGVDGMARVLDFGIAKAVTTVHTTREGQLKGKLRYMAPEQIQDGALSAATDTYGLSVTLWELLTGERLFTASNDAAILAKVLASPVVKPSRLAPGVPREIDEIVLRGLSRDPAARFATAHEMAVALESTGAVALPRAVSEWISRVASERLALCGEAVSAIERGVATVDKIGAPPPVLQTKTVVMLPMASKRKSTRRVLYAGAGLVALAALAGVEVNRRAARRPPVIASMPIAPESASEIATAAPPPESASAAPDDRDVPPTVQLAKPAVRGKIVRRTTPDKPCVPPYTEDENGIRHIKPACLKSAQ